MIRSITRRGRASEGEKSIDGAGVCCAGVVQTTSKADGTFPSDASGGGGVREPRRLGLMREETIVRKHLL